MRTFDDATGQRWTIDITVGAIKRVKGHLGVNLSDLHEGDPPLFTRLQTDLILAVDVLYAICLPQATERAVRDEDFAELLVGASIKQSLEAFWDALRDFFQGLGRTDIVEALDRRKEGYQKIVDASTSRIKSMDVAAMVTKAIQPMDQIQQPANQSTDSRSRTSALAS